MSTNTETLTAVSQIAGKYLTFVLGHECYGVPVLKIREIIRHCNITPVRQMPDHIKGVLNLRGKIIPVVDLRVKFRLDHSEDTELTCIIVMQIRMSDTSPTLMGMIVDAVEEVVNIAVADIEPRPDFGPSWNADYILGMAKIKGRVKTLLDIDRVLTAGDLLHPPGGAFDNNNSNKTSQ